MGSTFNWAYDWFDGFARGNANPGLVVVEEDGSAASYTFAELATTSDQVAHWFAEQGVSRGDAVIVMLGNQVELWQAMLAVMKLGGVLVPTTTAAGTADLSDRIERASARYVLCNDSDVSKLDNAAGAYTILTTEQMHAAYERPLERLPHPETAPDDRLLLYFTSGTTSQPKLVEHTQSSYPIGHLSTMYWLGLRPGDVHLNISSPGWAKHAWSCFFAPWLAESTVVVYNYARFDPVGLFEVLRTQRVTTFCAPPTVWRMLINADLSRGGGELREVASAGEPLNPEVIAQVQREWGLTVRDGFGQTETTALVGNPPGAQIKPGSMGRPLPGMPVVVVDPVTGQRVLSTPGEGEICLDLSERPMCLMAGYLDDAEGNSEAMAGGFYHTGDVASVDNDGYITFIGRTDDVFKSSDYKVSPFEVESVLIEHPAVAEAAVVPAPDPVRLAVPKAYVALAPGYEADRDTALAILAHAREHLAPWQRVRRIEFFELPKTISGKIRRVELRQREREGPSSGEFRDDQFPELRTPK